MNAELSTIHIRIEEPFAYITLNRPEVKNAMNQQMVSDLREAFATLHNNREVRGIVLSGAGGTFCAGGDIKEMQAAYSDPARRDTARTEDFDHLLRVINSAPQVIIARIEGAAMGGGLGLVCVSDIAIASSDAIFGLPEVRLGLIPAMILPYVIQRVGLTATRRLMLTGARFDSSEAAAIGMIHEACAPLELDIRVESFMAELHECSPQALAACKQLIFDIVDRNLDATAIYRANLLDKLRRSDDGQEGMQAFIEKRKPGWAP
jgi:isohexenylglutaconyl-CoA hydratase